MVKDFKIVLDTNRHYSPGSVVEGSIVVSVDRPKDYDKIIVTLCGTAKVEWTESRNKSSITYTNSETYVDAEVVVWKADNPFGSKLKLPIGEHNFPFSFQLPQNIPSSFKTASAAIYTGQIRYKVVARIVQSGLMKLNHMIRARLTVENRTPRTDILRRYSQPATVSETKQLKFLFLKRGSVSATVTIPRTGFSPGEVIPISVDMCNESSGQITAAFALTRKEKFIGLDPGGHVNQMSSFSKSIATTRAPIMPWAIRTIEDRYLIVPTEAVTAMQNCSCINVEYVVRVAIRIPWHSNLILKIPVVIVHND